MKSRKGLGVGQVFIFIITAITFALILIFGYMVVEGLISKGEKVAFVQFKTDLESSVKKIYTEYGAISKEDFFLPAKYAKICFVNMDYSGDKATQLEDLKKEDPIAAEAWESFDNYDSASRNVFLTPIAEVPIKVYHLEIYDKIDGEVGFHCKRIMGGSLTLSLEGRGDSTRINCIGCRDSGDLTGSQPGPSNNFGSG